MNFHLPGRQKAPPESVGTSADTGRTPQPSGPPALLDRDDAAAALGEVVAAVQTSPRDVNVEAHVTVDEKPDDPRETAGGTPDRTADPAQLIKDTGAEVERLSKALVGAVRVVPGGLLSTVGVGLLVATFWTEVVDSAALGAAEFIASVAAAVLMSLVGPVVISRDVGKADRLIESTVGASVESGRQAMRDRAELERRRRG
jgi:hypothetical protein